MVVHPCSGTPHNKRSPPVRRGMRRDGDQPILRFTVPVRVPWSRLGFGRSRFQITVREKGDTTVAPLVVARKPSSACLGATEKPCRRLPGIEKYPRSTRMRFRALRALKGSQTDSQSHGYGSEAHPTRSASGFDPQSLSAARRAAVRGMGAAWVDRASERLSEPVGGQAGVMGAA